MIVPHGANLPVDRPSRCRQRLRGPLSAHRHANGRVAADRAERPVPLTGVLQVSTADGRSRSTSTAGGQKTALIVSLAEPASPRHPVRAAEVYAAKTAARSRSTLSGRGAPATSRAYRVSSGNASGLAREDRTR